MNSARGVLPILLASLLWGTTGTAAHFLPATVSPLAIGAATMAIGGVLLFALSARGALGVIRNPSRRRPIVAGVIGIVIYPLAFYTSMHLAGVAIGAVVSLASAPVFAAVIELAVDRRAVTVRWATCTAVALVGTILLVGGRPSAPGAAASDAPLGVLLGLLAGLSYAVYANASHRVIGHGHGSGATMGALFGLGAVFLLPVLALTGEPLLRTAGSVAVTAYLAIGPMFLAYLLFGAGLRSVRGSTATTITLVEPLVATILAILVVGERLDPAGWIGLGLVMMGVTALVIRGRTSTGDRRNKQPSLIQSGHARAQADGAGRPRTTRSARR